MAHYKRIHAVKITLDVLVATDLDLGIYTVGGVSEIRWTEYPLAGISPPWKNPQ
jgi:hypothetical protein